MLEGPVRHCWDSINRGQEGGGGTQPSLAGSPCAPSLHSHGSAAGLPVPKVWESPHSRPACSPGFPCPSPTGLAGTCLWSVSSGTHLPAPDRPRLGRSLHTGLERKLSPSRCVPSKLRAAATLHQRVPVLPRALGTGDSLTQETLCMATTAVSVAMVSPSTPRGTDSQLPGAQRLCLRSTSRPFPGVSQG